MKGEKRLHPRVAPACHPVLAPKYVVRSTRCISCGTCIRACIYDCHARRADDVRLMADPEKESCRGCFACVLNCPRAALEMVTCEEYAAQGDATYTPAIIRSLQEQAAAGKIPVSGSGYGGAFDGPGYDAIWTDMSEIVRPTRDGIHGREAISTVVNLGRTISDLCGMEFDEDGNLLSHIPPTREIALPVMFGIPPFQPDRDGPLSANVRKALALAARTVASYMTVPVAENPEALKEHFNHLIIRLVPAELERYRRIIEWATIVEFEPDGSELEAIRRARDINPHLLTIIRAPVRKGIETEILNLAMGGAETVHLYADEHGRGEDGTTLIDCLRTSHLLLVEKGVRDRVTLLASGGLAAAEHVAKTIILGADAVLVGVPLLIALECTVCGQCRKGEVCPRQVGSGDVRWAATRIVNLMIAWRDQLLEVLGAMGLRDVRRLRGEAGRAIFADRVREDFVKRLGGAVGQTSAPPEEALVNENSAAVFATKAVSPAPSRFATDLNKHVVAVDRNRCTNCGLCVETCPYGVHQRTEGKMRLDEPIHSRCIGPTCLKNDWCCVHVCPWDALQVTEGNLQRVLGDKRWTAELLMGTWRQATSANGAGGVQVGDSGGGFDRLRIRPPSSPESTDPASVDLSISLNKRATGPRVDIAIPTYGGGMSYGSVSLRVMLGRAMAATALDTFTSTGEGGYPDELAPYASHVITQIATGLFGVREDTIKRARLVEFKYAQGAKPGLGGHLLGEKNTPVVAAMREAVAGTSLFSPFPFHSVYSVEDHKKHLDWIRSINPEALISVKVSTPGDVDMVAVGAYYAGANIIHLDGGYGGTGAAPDIAKKNIAQPIEYAVTQVHDFLVKEGIRDQVTLMASGGIRTAADVLKTIALGADGVVVGTAELIAIDCVRCGNCERDRGCPIGIATTDEVLSQQLTPEWVRERIVSMYRDWTAQMRAQLSALGLRSIRELVGRRDLLEFCP